MKIFQIIKNELAKVSSQNEYEKLLSTKCDLPDYKKWKQLISSTKICDEQLLNDTTGQNLAYFALYVTNRRIDNITINDVYCIQKSTILDLFIFYVKSTITVNHPNGNIAYPVALIDSPLSPHYASFFDEASSFVAENYPDGKIIPISRLGGKIKIEIPFFNARGYNYYEALFGHQGNILRHNIIGVTKYW